MSSIQPITNQLIFLHPLIRRSWPTSQSSAFVICDCVQFASDVVPHVILTPLHTPTMSFIDW